MANESSYLGYLPPVLWRGRPDSDESALGAALRIFEKILTGVGDPVVIEHGTVVDDAPRVHLHAPITAQIAQLHRVFDPWRTPERFLPWLASWVALEFPTLRGEPVWDEEQRRRVTAEIAQAYRLRGRKAGINAFLALYALGPVRPRVAVDDGSRVLATTPRPGQLAPVTSLVSRGPVVRGTDILAEGLISPSCLAVGSDGSLFIGDRGAPGDFIPQLPTRVWRINPAGQYDLAVPPGQTGPPRPRPLARGTTFSSVAAVAVRPAQGGTPETLYILDANGKLFALPAPYDANEATPVNLPAGSPRLRPVAMCVDRNGDLLVLDRVGSPSSATAPAVVTIRVNPVTLTSTTLRKVVEPLSMLVQPDGKLLIGDAGARGTGASPTPGNLVRVDRSSAASWTETALLPADNPLVAPTGLALVDSANAYVLDAGLKPFTPSSGNPFVFSVADPAVVHHVDLSTPTPAMARATEPGRFVYPVGMVATPGGLVICDPGLPPVAAHSQLSRLQPHRFDVIVQFAGSRLPADEAARRAAKEQVVGNILAVLRQHMPAHTLWNLVTQT